MIQLLRVRQTWPKKKSLMIRQMCRHPIFRHIQRKTNPCQLPLKKHMLASIYYNSAFAMYPRHNRPENISTNPDVLDLLLKVFSSRARVSTQKVWNPTIESWNLPKKSSFLSLPPLTQESNVGNDGLVFHFFHVREGLTTQPQLTHHAPANLISFSTTTASPVPKLTSIARHTQF